MYILVNLFEKDKSLAVAQQIMSKLGSKSTLSFQIWRECVSMAQSLLSRQLHPLPLPLPPLPPPTPTVTTVLNSSLNINKPPHKNQAFDLEVALHTLGIFCQKHYNSNKAVASICSPDFQKVYQQVDQWVGTRVIYPAADSQVNPHRFYFIIYFIVNLYLLSVLDNWATLTVLVVLSTVPFLSRTFVVLL